MSKQSGSQYVTMIDLVDKEISAGKSPMGLAATVLYISCLIGDENISQKNIAEGSRSN